MYILSGMPQFCFSGTNLTMFSFEKGEKTDRFLEHFKEALV
jgi:hypothetical protein